MAHPRYLPFEHPADIGIEVFGATLEELFANAAWGFCDTLTDATAVRSRVERRFDLQAADREELLVRWLSELLYAFETDRILFCVFRVERLTNTGLSVLAEGEPWDPPRHPVAYEIKAVTYHGLRIEEERSVWKAKILFDI